MAQSPNTLKRKYAKEEEKVKKKARGKIEWHRDESELMCHIKLLTKIYVSEEHVE